MKKLMIIILSLATVLSACSKNNDGPSGKDYSTAIKGKVWVGTATYTGKPTEYYSVQFNADNTLVWSEYADDYDGKWAVDGQQLNITFTLSGKQFNAGISDDNKLIDITYPAANSWVVNTGELCPNANIVLDNTKWNSPELTGFPGHYGLSLSFKQGSKIDYSVYLFLTAHLIYSRTGASIRFMGTNGYTWFGVITADGKTIRGMQSYEVMWEMVKQ
jgi:predicted small secreted protein